MNPKTRNKTVFFKNDYHIFNKDVTCDIQMYALKYELVN